MTGADHSIIYNNYSPTLANHLDPLFGAGTVDYARSLATLQAGEAPLDTVTAGLLATGATSASTAGWAYGTVAAGSADAVLIHADRPDQRA